MMKSLKNFKEVISEKVEPLFRKDSDGFSPALLGAMILSAIVIFIVAGTIQ